MSDWIDKYIDNSGLENNDTEPAFLSTSGCLSGVGLKIATRLKRIIRECKKSLFTEDNLKKLRFILVDEFCFNDIKGLFRRKEGESYNYFIFISKDALDMDEISFNHRVAHELAHFLFKLKNMTFSDKNTEDAEANKQVARWGFEQPGHR